MKEGLRPSVGTVVTSASEETALTQYSGKIKCRAQADSEPSSVSEPPLSVPNEPGAISKSESIQPPQVPSPSAIHTIPFIILTPFFLTYHGMLLIRWLSLLQEGSRPLCPPFLQPLPTSPLDCVFLQALTKTSLVFASLP